MKRHKPTHRSWNLMGRLTRKSVLQVRRAAELVERGLHPIDYHAIALPGVVQGDGPGGSPTEERKVTSKPAGT